MKDTISYPTISLFYELLLQLYPKAYRKSYGHEMRLLFTDLYREELQKNGEISIGFWLVFVWDVIKSTLEQHGELLKKIGLQHYLRQVFHINSYFVYGILLLIPFIIFSFIDFGTVFLTGNRLLLEPFYNSIFWKPPVILTVILVMPFFAMVINLTSILVAYNKREHKVISLEFIAEQFPNILLVLLGIVPFFLLLGHDYVPCVLNHFFHSGLLKLPQFLSSCRNA